MKKIGFIYKIISPSNKIYIGQTMNIVNRIYRYKALDCKRQTKLYNSIKKYGWSNHKFEIIEEITILENRKELDIREQYWISEYDSFKCGLNCNIGGCGNLGYKPTEEMKKKSVEARKGYKHSDETKKKIGISCKGYKHTDQTKEKISNSLKGRVAWNKGKKQKVNQ
jgi:group I intron endonuclease